MYRCHAITSKGLCLSRFFPTTGRASSSCCCRLPPRQDTRPLPLWLSTLFLALPRAHPSLPTTSLSPSPLSLPPSIHPLEDGCANSNTRSHRRVRGGRERQAHQGATMLQRHRRLVARGPAPQAMLRPLWYTRAPTPSPPPDPRRTLLSLTLECLYLSYPPGNSTAGATQETRAMYADYKLYRVFEATPVPLPPNERVRIILPPISRPIYRNLSQSIYRDLSVAIYLSIYHDLSRLLYHTMILFNVVDAALLMMILFLLLTRPVLAWTIRLLLIASSLASVRSLRSLSSFDARSNPKTYCLPLNPNPKNPNHQCAMSRRWCSGSD